MSTPYLIDGPRLQDGMGLCLSGGGYRAMLFHAGSVFRLNEAGLLSQLDRVSSVSGGSITAGALALAWSKLGAPVKGVFDPGNLERYFLEPVRRQAEDAIDVESIIGGLLPWKTAFAAVSKSYSANISGTATLQNLPDRPRFVFNTTNLMTGRDWRFAKPYAADYRVGKIERPTFLLADVMAASSAFPPFLSPAVFDISAMSVVDFDDASGDPHVARDLGMPPYTKRLVLTDGGIYDNLGLEPVWKRYRTIFASNAGYPFSAVPEPGEDWMTQLRRVNDVSMDQGEGLREMILVHAFKTGQRRGGLWGLGTPLSKYGLAGAPLLSDVEQNTAAQIATRLNYFDRSKQSLLLRAGYAHCDAALRAKYGANGEIQIAAPAGLPSSVA